MSTLLSDLRQRGCIHDVSHFEDLEQLLEKEHICFYCGFDPTGPSLHVGNLLPLVLMRRLQAAGHKPIALIGSATGMIGDPSGKSEERVLLSEEVIKENIRGIERQFAKIFSSKGDNAYLLIDNSEWLSPLSYVHFLRDVGKHFSVNAMIAKDSVKSRLENREQGISYTEFSYMLLQAYDYYWLNKQYNCRLQVGGSDQWGNITAGMDLIRRRAGEDHPPCYGMTFPLLTTATGTKFGKTEEGAVWLDAHMTSPYRFYQYWLNTADADVISCLSLFTELSAKEIAELKSELEANPEQRTAQRTLATLMTTLIHGPEETSSAETASKILFGGKISHVSSAVLLEIFSDVPSTDISLDALSQGVPLPDVLVQAELAASKGAARRLIEGGGIYLNNEKVSDPRTSVSLSHFIDDSVLVLRSGKKNYHLMRAS